jgi:dolichol-phosphate mannosyltransferase
MASASLDLTPIEIDPAEGLVSIILATFNERENICNTIDDIFEHVRPPVEIIIVDDDSPDRTWQVASELKDPRIKVIRRIATRGLASAFTRGILDSSGDYVGWMDADTCMPAATLARMLEALRTHDIAIGSRYVQGGSDNRDKLRALSSRLINGLARIVLAHGVNDADSGFVILRRAVFNKVLPIPTGYGEYFIEFIYVAKRKGLAIAEIGYAFQDRALGTSKSLQSLMAFSWLGLRYVYRIFRARLRAID